jgi:hypothetical protein
MDWLPAPGSGPLASAATQLSAEAGVEASVAARESSSAMRRSEDMVLRDLEAIYRIKWSVCISTSWS